jgi:serine/threonine protein kinase
LGKKLGEGRFGVVWVAVHKLTGGIFALKKIAKSTIRSNYMIEQFLL